MAPSIWRTRLRLDVIARWSGRRNPPLSMLPCPLLFWHRDILALAVEHAKTTDEHDLTDHVTSDRIEGQPLGHNASHVPIRLDVPNDLIRAATESLAKSNGLGPRVEQWFRRAKHESP